MILPVWGGVDIQHAARMYEENKFGGFTMTNITDSTKPVSSTKKTLQLEKKPKKPLHDQQRISIQNKHIKNLGRNS